jgi:hypothetical protein
MPEMQRRRISKMLKARVKNESRGFQKKQRFHHNVYVILLSDAVAKHPSIFG